MRRRRNGNLMLFSPCFLRHWPSTGGKLLPCSIPIRRSRGGRRKGISTAIEVTKALNQKGIPTELTICGLAGEPDGPIRFAGLFRKSVPEELGKYADLYRRAHLLIHPATFDPSPIVPAEAAAF